MVNKRLCLRTRRFPHFVRKKGQIKIQQTAFMLIALTLFFMLVGVGFLAYKIASLKESATSLQEENAKLLVTKLANTPEFSCGESFGSKLTNCVDLDKVMALKENIEKYTGFWGVAGISVIRIYPNEFVKVACTAKTYPNCGILEVYTSINQKGADYSNFVSLCRKELSNGVPVDKCEIGKLLIYPTVK